MTVDDAPQAGEDVVVGTTTFTARALQRLAVGLARDAARVAARDVGVQLSDERGALRITVTVPVAMGTPSEANLVDRGDGLRRALVEGMRDLAGREVGAVDVRYSGVRRNRKKRVR
ncbi:hypothetical protein [Microbacterium sp. MYb66]|jgi:hypothetical protein|uniref:hypothetical protein n=1 Tax=Microbacterium sp. MYb66 TaxID=1848692 RepID=UPI000D00F4FA|nr:hypothetical protein [Microbacterium sp. MYb66]PRA82011.1 hypothetical protein CQ045_04715 [Microbacterium sp. MYb66]